MDVKIINLSNGDNVGSLTLNDNVFTAKYNEALIHQVVNSFLSNSRSVTSCQKTRSEVSKSTKKPWKQKGTGRARAGTAASPLWRGGGRTFPNKPYENYTQKVNRKMYRTALSSILSQLIRDNRLIVCNTISLDTQKTKNFIQSCKSVVSDDNTTLIIIKNFNNNLFIASRNIPRVLIVESTQVNPYLLLRYNKICFEQDSILAVQEQLICN